MRQNEAYWAIFCTLKTTSSFIFLLLVVWSYLATNRKQESLANAKVNAWQHCVSLSCLGDKDSENIASERYENRHLRWSLFCLTPHISRTHANICITLISLETTFTGLHCRCWWYGSICIRLAVVASQTREITRNSERIRPYSSSRSSKVIDFGVNRKPICDFLLVMNSNSGRILHRFRDIAAQRSKNRFFCPTPPSFEAPARGDPVRISLWNLPPKN